MKHTLVGLVGIAGLIGSFLMAPADSWGEAKRAKKTKVVSSTVFGVSPPILELNCTPGQRVSTSIKINNRSSDRSIYSIHPVGVVSMANQGIVSKPVATLPSEHLSRHLTFESSSVEIPGNSYKEVGIFIDVPASATGTNYAGLAVANESQTVDPEELRRGEYEVELGLGMLPGIGITIKCNMEGTLNYSYVLEDVKILPRDGNKPLSAEARIKNTGNGELRVIPSLVLLDGGKKLVARFSGDSSVAIAPGESKTVSFKPMYKPLSPGRYTAVLSVPDPKYKLAPIERGGVVVR